MFEKLTLKNFQCHKRLNITFGKHVTTIVGPSDVGKSAVIRALKWLVANKPSGDAFRKEGTKQTFVGLKFDGGRKLVRRKGNSTNEMILDDKEYKAFGTDVPETISDAINISELNFQGQHDSPFWFSETAGQVSRELNAIVNLDVIDSTLKNIASELRKAKSAKEVGEERLREAKEERDNLSYVDDLSEDFEDLIGHDEILSDQVFRLADIEELEEEASKYQKASETHRRAHSDGLRVVRAGGRWVEGRERLTELVSLGKKAVEEKKKASIKLPKKEEMEEMKNLWEELGEAKSKVGKLDSVISEVEKNESAIIELPEKEEIEEVENLWVGHKEKESKIIALDSMISEIENQKEQWLEDSQAVILAKRELNDKSEGICPLCGNEMKEVV